MKVVAYLRTASWEHASFEKQKQIVVEFIDNMNYELVKIYEDFNTPGTELSPRKSMQELLDDSKGDNFDMVIVKSLTILSRNPKDSIMILNTLQMHNKKVFAFENSLLMI